jgi:hypothetical protein
MYPYVSPKWTVIVQNMAGTGRNLHQLLVGKQLYSALYAVYKKVQHDLMAVLKDNTSKGETAKPKVLQLRPLRNSVSTEN